MSCVIISSMYGPADLIISSEANCPAEVKLEADIKTASSGVKPAFLAATPNVNETAR